VVVVVMEELTGGGGRQRLLDWKAPGTLVDPGGMSGWNLAMRMWGRSEPWNHRPLVRPLDLPVSFTAQSCSILLFFRQRRGVQFFPFLGLS
jgi:hypothetical protein